jgi:MATE family multidrug resistance protein
MSSALPASSPHRSLRFGPAAFFGMAAPMVVSRAGLAAMGIADGIMVARFSPRGFACLSLAEGTLGRLLDVGVAFLIGALSLVPRHVARGDRAGAYALWRRTVPVALAIGCTCAVAGGLGRQLLSLAGQSPDLSASAGPIMAILGAGHAAALVAISAAVYLENLGRPAPVAIAVAAANIVNVGLNYLLIGGHLGLPALGARGSAVSTTVVRVCLGVTLGVAAWRTRPKGPITLPNGHRSQWALGFGTAGTVAAIVGLTSSLTVFAGWLGVVPLAAFAATFGLAMPVGLVTLGLTDATGLFVSAEAGRSGDARAGAVARSGLALTLAIVVPLAVLLAIAGPAAATVYTTDPALRSAIASITAVAAAVLVVDAVGFTLASSLRALRDVAWPAAIDIGSMTLLVPVAASLALTRGMGARGLFLAMLVAAVVRAALLAARLRVRTSAEVVPVEPVEVGA